MKRTIKKVAVLGSGIMGSRIACHFANIGLEVLLLDIAPRIYMESMIDIFRQKDIEKFTNDLSHGWDTKISNYLRLTLFPKK